ncbi:MAG: hypothetical protein L0H64_08265 [Pseudonocardia sp.]|nr:hypothetical protein [Pseudonocardia sp.]
MSICGHSNKRQIVAQGFCAVCGKVNGVGVDGTFHRHRSSPGTVCAGSGNPLHAPGQHGRTVATYALLRDEVHDGIVMAHMSPGRHRLRLLLIVGGVGSADIVQLPLTPGQVRRIAEDLGAWVRAARQVLDPLEATGLATGTVAASPDVTWKRALPAVRPVSRAGAGLVKAQTGSGVVPELALCAVRTRPERISGFAVLDLDQVARLRDGLESWLGWTDFLQVSGLHPAQLDHNDPEGPRR